MPMVEDGEIIVWDFAVVPEARKHHLHSRTLSDTYLEEQRLAGILEG